jgi:hypothetical protein
MFTKGKTFLFLVILAGITAAATLRLTLHSAVNPVPEKGARFRGSTSKYSSDSNKQLQSTALGLVTKIRGLTDSYNKNDRDLMAEYQTNYLATRTTERQLITDEWKKKSAEAYDSTVRDFKTTLLSESKAVRAELHRRLPERLHRPNLSKIYENPSSVMEMQIIADDLDLLSKSLADS